MDLHWAKAWTVFGLSSFHLGGIGGVIRVCPIVLRAGPNHEESGTPNPKRDFGLAQVL